MKQFIEFYQKTGFTKIAFVLMFIIGLWGINFGEKVGLRDGKGWDGVTFVYYTQHFDSLISNRLINTAIRDTTLTLTHKTNRFFPSMAVHYAMKALDIHIETLTIIETFDWYNFFCLLLGAIAVGIIGKNFALQEKSKWLLFGFLFLNFAFLKRNFYEPALTDTTALVLCIWLIAFFSMDSWKGTLGIMLVAIIAAFTWQPITIYAYFLIFFPRKIKVVEQRNLWISIPAWTIFAAGFFYNFWTFYTENGIEGFNKMIVTAWGQQDYYAKGLKIAALAATVYTACYFGFLLKNISFKNFFSLYKPDILWRILPLPVLWFVVNFLNSLVAPAAVASNPDVTSSVMKGVAASAVSNPLSFIFNFAYHPSAVHLPLEFIFMQIAFFGLAYLIALFFYDQFTDQIRKEGGLGMICIFLVSYANSLLIPESRIGLAMFPFIALFSVLLIDRANWSNKIYCFLGILIFLVSKVWLHVGNFVDDLPFSYERWHLNSGMWINLRWYAITAFVFLCLGTLFWLLTRAKSVWNDIKEGNILQKLIKLLFG
ncbi:MAG: hypothetical protein EAZ97_04080 [Bacteroidetes bacterium]|nr:MAG: hypothetical protein EAZ97_04080 [Bacteroidota bacterium]